MIEPLNDADLRTALQQAAGVLPRLSRRREQLCHTDVARLPAPVRRHPVRARRRAVCARRPWWRAPGPPRDRSRSGSPSWSAPSRCSPPRRVPCWHWYRDQRSTLAGTWAGPGTDLGAGPVTVTVTCTPGCANPRGATIGTVSYGACTHDLTLDRTADGVLHAEVKLVSGTDCRPDGNVSLRRAGGGHREPRLERPGHRRNAAAGACAESHPRLTATNQLPQQKQPGQDRLDSPGTGRHCYTPTICSRPMMPLHVTGYKVEQRQRQ